MLLSVDFDLLLVMILLAMFLIGYISGATVEIIKLINLIVPFIVIYFFAGDISRWVFRTKLLQKLLSKFTVLEHIPYFNTFVVFLATFITFLGAYWVLSYMTRGLKKIIVSEVLDYKLGKFNHSAGAILALIRFYVLGSLLVLPFFVLGLTTKEEDHLSRLLLNHPPMFTRAGQIINDAEPMVNAVSSLSSFIEVVDVRETMEEVKALETTITEQKEQLTQTIQGMVEQGTIVDVDLSDPMEVLLTFLKDPTPFFDAAETPELRSSLTMTYNNVKPYEGVVAWAHREDIVNLSHEQKLISFFENYDYIQDETSDPSVKDKLNKMKSFQIVYEWLTKTVKLNLDPLAQILSDSSIERIMNQLLLELDQEGLLTKLRSLQQPKLNAQADAIESFVVNYKDHYAPLMKKIKVELPFLYKLIAATMHEVDLIEHFKRTPFIAMYVIDTIQLLNTANLELPDENLYQLLIKIIIPLYLIEEDDNGRTIPMDEKRMEKIITGSYDLIDDLVLTDNFVQELVRALIEATTYEESTKTTIPYLTYLLAEGMITREALLVLQESAYIQEEDLQVKLTNVINEEGGAR